MAVAALRRYQAVSPFKSHSAPDACRNILGILLNGIVRHAAAAAPEDFDAFADRINSLAEGIEAGDQSDLRQMVLTAQSAVEAFEAYTISAAQNAADRENELRDTILATAEGFFALANLAPNRAVGLTPERLDGLRHELRAATDLPSLKNLKTHLAEIVHAGIAPRPQVKTQSAQPAHGHATPHPETTPGHSQRKAAEDAIRNALVHPGKTFVVTVVMDSLQTINHQYGTEIGDRVLKELGLQLQRYLTSADRLYRWTGPAFTALVHREESIDYMRAMIRRIFEPPPEKEFDVDGHKVAISLSAIWSVVALIPPATNIYNYIDRFAASQRLRETV